MQAGDRVNLKLRRGFDFLEGRASYEDVELTLTAAKL